jgi:O-antigen/teichoic acid export membrane protein
MPEERLTSCLAIASRRPYHQGSRPRPKGSQRLADQRPRHARRKRNQVVGALTDPHYRSGYALVANTVGTTAIGVAYWAIAAHLYDRQVLGRSSALVSALVLVSSIAQLNLGSTLPRFLPLAYRRSGRLIGYTYIATSVVALAVGLGFVTLLPRLNAQWHFLGGSAGLALTFVAATIVWGIFALQDAALTGLRHASIVPVENVVYGVFKLILLIGIASLLPSTGIFISWVLPLVLIIPAINWLIFRKYVKLPESLGKGARIRPREVIRFAAIDYAGSLLGQIYIALMPLLVLSILGAAANGTFYVAWTITSGLALVANNFATSLLVEGAAAPDRLPELTRGVLIRCAWLMTLGVALLVLGARPILTIYGAQYATQASTLLGLLALTVLPRSLVVITFSLDRLAGRVGRASLTNLVLGVLVLGGTWLSLTRFGIDGVALAWGGGHLVIALVRAPTIIGAVRGQVQPAVARPTPAAGADRSGAHRQPADLPLPGGAAGAQEPQAWDSGG